MEQRHKSLENPRRDQVSQVLSQFSQHVWINTIELGILPFTTNYPPVSHLISKNGIASFDIFMSTYLGHWLRWWELVAEREIALPFVPCHLFRTTLLVDWTTKTELGARPSSLKKTQNIYRILYLGVFFSPCIISARSAGHTGRGQQEHITRKITRLVDQIRSLCWSVPQEIRYEFISILLNWNVLLQVLWAHETRDCDKNELNLSWL